jgi:hypothetical protein
VLIPRRSCSRFQTALRRFSVVQGGRLNFAVVCHHAATTQQQCIAQSSPNTGGGSGLQNAVASGTPGCALDSSLWHSIYQRSSSFVGYLVWLTVLALLWVCVFCVAAGPVVFLRLDLWPPLRACLPGGCVGAEAAPVPHVVRLQAARVKEGVLVAALCALRLAYLAMLVAIAFQTRAPTFACVEFSFNRRGQPAADADPTPYTTTPFELIQAVFYPVFLLAVIGREEWFDAEMRYLGVLVHSGRSRRHMVLVSLLRRAVAVLAALFIAALLVALVVVLASGASVDHSPLRGMARGAQVRPPARPPAARDLQRGMPSPLPSRAPLCVGRWAARCWRRCCSCCTGRSCA